MELGCYSSIRVSLWLIFAWFSLPRRWDESWNRSFARCQVLQRPCCLQVVRPSNETFLNRKEKTPFPHCVNPSFTFHSFLRRSKNPKGPLAHAIGGGCPFSACTDPKLWCVITININKSCKYEAMFAKMQWNKSWENYSMIMNDSCRTLHVIFLVPPSILRQFTAMIGHACLPVQVVRFMANCLAQRRTSGEKAIIQHHAITLSSATNQLYNSFQIATIRSGSAQRHGPKVKHL